MKIGLVRRGYSPTGGAENYLLRFAAAAAGAGHGGALFTEQWPKEAWAGDYFRLGSTSPKSFADALLAAHPRESCDFLFSLERVWECDAYRAGDGVHAAWLEHRARFEPRWKSVFRRFSLKHQQTLALEKHLFSPAGARLVIANSQMVADEISQHFAYPAERIHLVHNGVPPFVVAASSREETRRALGLADDHFLVLFAGSGWERKGLRFAIDAVNAMDTLGVTLLVAGRGSRRTLPDSPRVRYLGPVADLACYLAAADAFLLPTLYDPFSNACLEALAAGLPVITTAQNGFSEVIIPGRDGEVVERADATASITQALQRWSDPARRVAARPHLRLIAERLTMAENVRKTLTIIEMAGGVV